MFVAIAKAMEEMVEDTVDCYWITRCFVNQLNTKYRDALPQLVRAGFLVAVRGRAVALWASQNGQSIVGQMSFVSGHLIITSAWQAGWSLWKPLDYWTQKQLWAVYKRMVLAGLALVQAQVCQMLPFSISYSDLESTGFI